MTDIEYKKNTYLYTCGLDGPRSVEVIKNIYYNYTHNVQNTNSSYLTRYITHSDNVNRLKKELDQENIQYQSNFHIDDVEYDIRLLHSNIVVAIQSSSTRPTVEKIQIQSETARKNEMICYHLYDWNNYAQFVKSLQSRYEIKEDSYAVQQLSSKEGEIFTKKFNQTNVLSRYTINIGIKRTDTLKRDIIMMMSFGLSENSTYEWLITQMTTKPHYMINNGYIHIFDTFVKMYDPRSIRGILDRSKSSGSMIRCLGFEKIDQIPSQIVWSQYKSAISTRLIKSIVNIADNDLCDMMIDAKYLPVPDCGYDVYEWRR